MCSSIKLKNENPDANASIVSPQHNPFEKFQVHRFVYVSNTQIFTIVI